MCRSLNNWKVTNCCNFRIDFTYTSIVCGPSCYGTFLLPLQVENHVLCLCCHGCWTDWVNQSRFTVSSKIGSVFASFFIVCPAGFMSVRMLILGGPLCQAAKLCSMKDIFPVDCWIIDVNIIRCKMNKPFFTHVWRSNCTGFGIHAFQCMFRWSCVNSWNIIVTDNISSVVKQLHKFFERVFWCRVLPRPTCFGVHFFPSAYTVNHILYTTDREPWTKLRFLVCLLNCLNSHLILHLSLYDYIFQLQCLWHYHHFQKPFAHLA